MTTWSSEDHLLLCNLLGLVEQMLAMEYRDCPWAHGDGTSDWSVRTGLAKRIWPSLVIH